MVVTPPPLKKPRNSQLRVSAPRRIPPSYLSTGVKDHHHQSQQHGGSTLLQTTFKLNTASPSPTRPLNSSGGVPTAAMTSLLQHDDADDCGDDEEEADAELQAVATTFRRSIKSELKEEDQEEMTLTGMVRTQPTVGHHHHETEEENGDDDENNSDIVVRNENLFADDGDVHDDDIDNDDGAQHGSAMDFLDDLDRDTGDDPVVSAAAAAGLPMDQVSQDFILSLDSSSIAGNGRSLSSPSVVRTLSSSVPGLDDVDEHGLAPVVVPPMAHYMVKPAVVMGKHGVGKGGSKIKKKKSMTNNRSSRVTKKKQQQKGMKKMGSGKTVGKGSSYNNNNNNMIQKQLSFGSVVKKQQTVAAYTHDKENAMVMVKQSQHQQSVLVARKRRGVAVKTVGDIDMSTARGKKTVAKKGGLHYGNKEVKRQSQQHHHSYKTNSHHHHNKASNNKSFITAALHSRLASMKMASSPCTSSSSSSSSSSSFSSSSSLVLQCDRNNNNDNRGRNATTTLPLVDAAVQAVARAAREYSDKLASSFAVRSGTMSAAASAAAKATTSMMMVGLQSGTSSSNNNMMFSKKQRKNSGGGASLCSSSTTNSSSSSVSNNCLLGNNVNYTNVHHNNNNNSVAYYSNVNGHASGNNNNRRRRVLLSFDDRDVKPLVADEKVTTERLLTSFLNCPSPCAKKTVSAVAAL